MGLSQRSSSYRWQTLSLLRECNSQTKLLSLTKMTHIVLSVPVDQAVHIITSKDFFSIVLLAVVDSNYKVLLVDCGGKGKISDAGIVKISYFVVVKLVN